MLCVWLYRVESHVVPVRPGDNPPEGSRLLGYLEIAEEELHSWQEALAAQAEPGGLGRTSSNSFDGGPQRLPGAPH
jgi:hypothetical protein